MSTFIFVTILGQFVCSPLLAIEKNESTNHSITDTTLVSYGSDTLANMMHFWGKLYSKRYPSVELELHSEGSSTASKALINQTSSLGPMSRLMSTSELTAFKNKYGYYPTAIKVGMDAIAVFVNRNNPLSKISVQQLDAVFSNYRKCGHPQNIEYWKELGVEQSWGDRKIELIGRNNVSGTYTFFRQKALCNGRFKSRVLNQPGSTSVVQVVSHSLYSIGFSALGYKTSGIKALSIINSEGQVIEATPDTVQNQTYPLARFLYIYINQAQDKKLADNVANFLNIALSQEGQAIVKQDGYVALPENTRLQELNKLLH
ncbi:PstS family phosphate ABC transporter substrate-binding protein [Paraglaciecola sp. L3A3]|uniref:PstS family phosphate ABC transporter substrate-binding protein n=1 Tax=Paraglaciecola sp. L3A3 TaxID=2686358 RepID=UPI00131E627E|nr:PstS family phosphate ABC transporter substrate-binding protein [Paraglaciecola sp. L3A3]